MKALTLLALAGFACLATAEGRPLSANAQDSTAPSRYNYAMNLDIARVIHTDEIPEVCAVVPVRMVYEDSHGERHTLEYSVMGKGCMGF